MNWSACVLIGMGRGVMSVCLEGFLQLPMEEGCRLASDMASDSSYEPPGVVGCTLAPQAMLPD